MPYHADALGVSWEELPTNYQGFVLGSVQAMGAGSIGVALALLIMLLVPFPARSDVGAMGRARGRRGIHLAYRVRCVHDRHAHTRFDTVAANVRAGGPVSLGRAHLHRPSRPRRG